ncbi:ISAzo13 family transposase [bacterium]|nr:ISAzo13 family transposase [bacterium]
MRLAELFPTLNERQRRRLAAVEAREYGWGGISFVASVTGMSRQTITNGIKELGQDDCLEQIRCNGGGRKKISASIPELLDTIEEIVGETTRGDPESPLKWTCKSVRNITEVLLKKGFQVGRQSVANLLHELDYSLQANRKTDEGKEGHPDRDDQFKHINKKSKSFIRGRCPVISVDTKKKELVGNYHNNGREWQYKSRPIVVLDHDFPNPKVSKAVPYGIFDIADNKGWVNVGTSADTAEFAVESIRQWWKRMGSKKYPMAKKLLITADCGGSNSYRVHLWKVELQKLANETDLKITVSHYPPGTSKWNKIEHKLFSFISINWRGRPLVDYRTVVDLISGTKSTAGLEVKARLDRKKYKKGKKATKEQVEALNISRDKFHGEWNYTIKPKNV